MIVTCLSSKRILFFKETNKYGVKTEKRSTRNRKSLKINVKSRRPRKGSRGLKKTYFIYKHTHTHTTLNKEVGLWDPVDTIIL